MSRACTCINNVFQDNKTEPVTEPVSVGTAADSSKIESSQAVENADPFKKYQDIRHQDFGEIVFRKQKRQKKKANKGMLY